MQEEPEPERQGPGTYAAWCLKAGSGSRDGREGGWKVSLGYPGDGINT